MESITKKFCMAAAVVALVLMFAISALAAMPGDMDHDGKVTPADARIVLRISVGLEKLEDYFPDWKDQSGTDDPGTDEPDPQEIPEDLEFLLAYTITDDGYFVAGESTAAISVTANANLASAKLTIADAAGETVFTKTLTKLKKDKPVTVEWDGKKGEDYALSGDYTVTVSAGEKTTKLEGLTFTQKNYFGDGNGSEAHPFTVASREDFANVVRFSKAHFKQTMDIDYALEAGPSMFTSDVPFNGVYDGNGKAFTNLVTTNPLINYVGADGIVKNVTIKDSSFTCKAALTFTNKGQISGCDIDVKINVTGGDLHEHVGMLCENNTGLLLNCSTKGLLAANHTHWNGYLRAGGIAGQNSGKILSCSSSADIKVTGEASKEASGIVGSNWSTGFIKNCEASGSLSSNYNSGIASCNDGQILDCFYTGSTSVKLVSSGAGIVA